MFAKSLLLLGVVVCVVYCRPRDNYNERIAQEESLVLGEENLHIAEKTEYQAEVDHKKTLQFKKVACSVKGPGADQVCTDYCGRKGYHHGVCISFECNCV